jgi:hypothetical protein
LCIGNSNLILSFNKGICGGILPCPFGEFGRGCELVEEEEDGGGEAPFPPFPFGFLSPLSPLFF